MSISLWTRFSDCRPLRLVDVQADRLAADLNHPLAERGLDVAVRIDAIRDRGDQRSGRRTEVNALITDNGPGMQARWRGQASVGCAALTRPC